MNGQTWIWSRCKTRSWDLDQFEEIAVMLWRFRASCLEFCQHNCLQKKIHKIGKIDRTVTERATLVHSISRRCMKDRMGQDLLQQQPPGKDPSGFQRTSYRSGAQQWNWAIWTHCTQFHWDQNLKKDTQVISDPQKSYMYANALMPNGLDPYLQIAEHREVGTQWN